MKLTDKWFWWLWIVTEVIIVFIGFHELGFTKEWIRSMVYLGLPQPLMILLILLKKNHHISSLLNLAAILLYSIIAALLALFDNYSDKLGSGLWWFCFMTVLPYVQLAIILVYWSVEILVISFKRKNLK